MPYNTRRKSLSLSELGITVPKRSRAISHPSPPSTIAEGDEPPVKKSKRSHASGAPSPASMSPPRTTSTPTIRIKEEKPTPASRAAELSPPPSPGREGASKIDTEGINDGIVVAAIQQLEKTGNRPHLVKELAAALAPTVNMIERSANPSALISSRLTAYLNRPWPAVGPCPLAKDLSPVHPRRLYFYLTTSPHQAIPEVPEPVLKPARIISPSISSASAADEEETHLTRARTALSPSPEVDLSSPELEDEQEADSEPTRASSFSARNSISREHPGALSNLAHNRRAVSPQLEHEEKDFKQTANALHEQYQQRRSGELGQAVKVERREVESGAENDGSVAMSVETESEEHAALRNKEFAASLFGHSGGMEPSTNAMDFTSPMIAPQEGMRVHVDSQDVIMDHIDLDAPRTRSKEPQTDDDCFDDPLLSPENVELGDLDDMFD
ncbi:hypothetical protein MBLNU230_g3392t1 [Neophaeotheca triangularis]